MARSHPLDAEVAHYAARVGLWDDVDWDDPEDWGDVVQAVARRFDLDVTTAIDIIDRVAA